MYEAIYHALRNSVIIFVKATAVLNYIRPLVILNDQSAAKIYGEILILRADGNKNAT